MYQFSTTNIINSSLDSNGTTAKFAGSSTNLSVARVGKFLKDGIVSIYKRGYYAGVKEVAKVRIPTVAAGLVARLTVDVRLSQQTNSEYASTYMYFKKPVTVEILASGTAATDAAAFVAQIKGLKDRFGVSYITAAVIDTDYVQITATDANQRIYSIIVEKEKTSTNSIIQPEYENITASTFSVTTAGKTGFGDDDWMARRIILPTAENVRYFGVSKDERPILGGNYTQYTLRYKIDKDPSEGIVAEGKSITTHVFYVLSSLVSEFETEIAKVGVAILDAITETGALALSTIDSTIVVGDNTKVVATGAVGTVTFASGTTGVATVNSSTGVVTGVSAGTSVITATDTYTGGTKTATITITVIA